MRAIPSQTLTASATVGQSLAVYHGWTVTTATATGAINFRRGNVTGQIIDVIPAGTVAGTTRYFDSGIAFGNQPIFVEFNGGATGAVVVLYE